MRKKAPCLRFVYKGEGAKGTCLSLGQTETQQPPAPPCLLSEAPHSAASAPSPPFPLRHDPAPLTAGEQRTWALAGGEEAAWG